MTKERVKNTSWQQSYPNRSINPNSSMTTPKKGHFKNTSKTPKKKQTVPLSFSFREKKTIVLLIPITSVMPPRNKIYTSKNI